MEPNLPLRDIHLPAPIGWWPPAPGWWLLVFGIPTLVILLVWLWRFLRRKTVKKLALKELEAIAQSDADGREKVQRLGILLRQVCLSLYPREQVASLVGAEWLELLDRTSAKKGKPFSEGIGKLLIEAAYRREIETDVDALFTLCRDWIKRLVKPKKIQAKLISKSAKQLPPWQKGGRGGFLDTSTESQTQQIPPNHPFSKGGTGQMQASTDNRRFARPENNEEAKP